MQVTTAEVWTGCGKAAPSSQVNRPAVELHVHSPEPTPGSGRSLLVGITPGWRKPMNNNIIYVIVTVTTIMISYILRIMIYDIYDYMIMYVHISVCVLVKYVYITCVDRFWDVWGHPFKNSSCHILARKISLGENIGDIRIFPDIHIPRSPQYAPKMISSKWTLQNHNPSACTSWESRFLCPEWLEGNIFRALAAGWNLNSDWKWQNTVPLTNKLAAILKCWLLNGSSMLDTTADSLMNPLHMWQVIVTSNSSLGFR